MAILRFLEDGHRMVLRVAESKHILNRRLTNHVSSGQIGYQIPNWTFVFKMVALDVSV